MPIFGGTIMQRNNTRNIQTFKKKGFQRDKYASPKNTGPDKFGRKRGK